MISLVEGEGLGAGKSYYVCTILAAHLAQGGTCYMTDDFEVRWSPLYGPLERRSARGSWETLQTLFGRRDFVDPRPRGMAEMIANSYGVHAEPEQIQVIPSDQVWRIHELTPPGTDDLPVLIVIDEAQGGLNTRDTRESKKRELFDWCCQSRHDNNDLIFITQNVNNIDVTMRRLASNYVVVKNLARDGGLPIIGPVNRFLWRFLAADGKRQYSFKLPRFDWAVMGSYVSKSCQGKHRRLEGVVVPRRRLRKVERKRSSARIVFALALAVLVALLLLDSLQ